MTPEKAIKHIEALIANERHILKLSNENEARHLRKIEALEMAKQALEKQLIPKKPIATEEQNIRFAMNYICPSCKKHFTGTGIADYCYHCGQALDWGDEK